MKLTEIIVNLLILIVSLAVIIISSDKLIDSCSKIARFYGNSNGRQGETQQRRLCVRWKS